MDLPEAFKERIKIQLGDSYEDFLAACQKERVFGLRYNPLKTDKKTLRAALLKQQTMLEDVEWAEEGFYYPPDTQPGKLPLHEAGAYYIQEPSAMTAVPLLDPGPGEKILDLCAAPGGKSTHIAGRMKGEGLLVSNETVSQRAKILSRNMERMGVVNAVVLNETPERLAERFPLFFDRILADAPCSGEGMFRKDENARGEWSIEQTGLCARRQRDILTQAVRMLKPGGILVYSTCTFAPVENEEMTQWLVKEYPELSLEHEEQIWPHLKRGEGHYAVRFRKAHFTKEGPVLEGTAISDGAVNGAEKCTWQKKCREFSGKTVSGKRKYRELSGGAAFGKRKHSQDDREELLASFCREVLSEQAAAQILEQVQKGQLAAFGDQLYLVPPGIGSLDGLKTERPGLQLGCCRKNRFEPSHALAMALHPEEVRQTLELEEPERYIRGETVTCSGQKGWTLVTTEGCSLGWGKASQGVLKNHYPKGLRRG